MAHSLHYCKVAHQETCKGYRIVVTKFVGAYGGHPCGYVGIPKSHPFAQRTDGAYEWPIECHGGLTYDGRQRKLDFFDEDEFAAYCWVGWDYAHYGDYLDYTSPVPMVGQGKVHPVEEVLAEARQVVEQFIRLEQSEQPEAGCCRKLRFRRS